MEILFCGIVMILTVLLGCFLFENQAYALWEPLSSQELLEQSKTIFVGNVTFVTPVDVQYQSQIARNGMIKQSVGPETMTLDEYTIHVEEFLKNPQDYDTIKLRQATVSGVPSGPSTLGGFEVGDRVLFYLPKYENQTYFPMQYLPESFKIPKYCVAKDVLTQKKLEARGESFTIQNGIKVDNNFTANRPVYFVDNEDDGTLSGKSFDTLVRITKITGSSPEIVLSKEIHSKAKPCEWIASAEWEFTPREGEYRMDVIIQEDNKTYAQYNDKFFVKPDVVKSDYVSPLKQFRSGIAANDIICEQGLQLVIKVEDNSPACVKFNTATMLIKHGWASSESGISSDGQRTYVIQDSSASSISCDTTYPQSSTGVAVLYMPANSTGKICTTYYNPDSLTQSSTRVFAAKDMQQQASEITISAYPDVVPTGNSTIVYTIKTGSQAGLYGMSFFCGSIPFAVGYDNQSGIILDDFPWLYKNDICLSQTNVFQITGLSGIHVQYVTEVHRG